MREAKTANGMNRIEDERPFINDESIYYQDSMPVIEIDDGEKHYVVAEDFEEAVQAHAVDSMGFESLEDYINEYGDVMKCTFLNAGELVKVCYDDGSVIEQPAWKWAIEKRGVFASTSW